MPRSSHRPWLYHYNYIWRRVQVMKLSPVNCDVYSVCVDTLKETKYKLKLNLIVGNRIFSTPVADLMLTLLSIDHVELGSGISSPLGRIIIQSCLGI
jgi:hypothetical protein